MALAILVALALTFLRPTQMDVAPTWALPTVELVLLATLIIRDPGRIDRRTAGLRVVSIIVVGLLAVDALWATVRLITVLIEGGKTTSSAQTLLQAGGVVWASNVIVFALLYWELDGGGAAARVYRLRAHPDLAFPQQLTPEIAPPGWRPSFIDYLYLGLTNSTAFSPTDVMPLAPWAKIVMGCQSLMSLVILGLVVARAVNVLS
jgi:uncharacterized membrane protein